MKNNKGFSMVELLAVIVILGILFGIGMQAYSKYREKAKQQGYDTMAKSASHAAEEYKMEHPAATSIEFKKLKEEGYLSSLEDPGSKGGECSGKVNISTLTSDDGQVLDENSYAVSICCANYYYFYSFPDGEKMKIADDCTADSMAKVASILTSGKTIDTLEQCDTIAVASEKFKVVSTTEDTITVIPFENITLSGFPVQSEDARTTRFSRTRYWPPGSSDIDMGNPSNLVQPYILKYKKTLETMGLKNVSVQIARQFTSNGNCQNPGQHTGYWTNSPNPADYSQGVVKAISKKGLLTYPMSSNTTGYGVRPIVTFSKDSIRQ